MPDGILLWIEKCIQFHIGDVGFRSLCRVQECSASGILVSIGTGSYPYIPFEGFDEVTLIDKSTLYRHLRQGHLVFREQALRARDTVSQHTLVRTLSQRLAEHSRKIMGTEPDLLPQGFQRQLLIEMGLNEVHRVSYLFIG